MKKIENDAGDQVDFKHPRFAAVLGILLALLGVLPVILAVPRSTSPAAPGDPTAASRHEAWLFVWGFALVVLTPICIYSALVLFRCRVVMAFSLCAIGTLALWGFSYFVIVWRLFAGWGRT